MTTYQFEIDDDLWDEWKEGVPRTKTLEQRIRELIVADTEGRVAEQFPDDRDVGTAYDLEQLVADADWSNSNYACTEARVEGVAAALELLRANETATTPELVEMIEQHLGDSSNNQRMLSDLAGELDEVETPPPGSNVYRWVGQ